jgi:hypothetical protein
MNPKIVRNTRDAISNEQQQIISIRDSNRNLDLGYVWDNPNIIHDNKSLTQSLENSSKYNDYAECN